tara:strand:- start:1549 stop:2865 length:1317 start_codon:yes stop_codon:yes gene_type:complete
MTSNLTLWQPDSGELIPRTAKTPVEIAGFAEQLSPKDKKQIVAAFDGEHYEMGLNFLWSRTAIALRRELASVGITLIGEMLGRTDIDEDDDIEDVVTIKEAIKLSEELGIVTKTDAMRLRHTNEIISHFGQLSLEENDIEDIDESEAITSLKTCIKSVLGRPKVEVATKFVEFRNSLEKKGLLVDDPIVDMLASSPYFFQKLTISILMNSCKTSIGAQLENTLSNVNVILPALWKFLRDSEKWKVGHTYAEVFSEGKTSSVTGLKSALSKVQGFDFVPENLRSDAFIKAASNVIKAHEGMNNFYNELAPLKALSKLGSVIPTPALNECISAILCIKLGNYYGVSNAAQALASDMLESIPAERWQSYINQMLISDTRILNKLGDDRPQKRWFELSEKLKFNDLSIKGKDLISLINASVENKSTRFDNARKRLLKSYYGE